MGKNEGVVAAPTRSVTKSSVRRSARLGCKENLMPPKGRLTPSVSRTSSVSKKVRSAPEQEPPARKLNLLDFYRKGEALKYADSLECAGRALELYQKSHKEEDGDFEIIQVLYLKDRRLAHPKLKGSLQHWYHMCFTAKPKNNNCSSDVSSPTYFFAELKSQWITHKRIPYYCYPFVPSDDKPGFNHGCSICKTDCKIHPGPGEYEVGAPPYTARGYPSYAGLMTVVNQN